MPDTLTRLLRSAGPVLAILALVVACGPAQSAQAPAAGSCGPAPTRPQGENVAKQWSNPPDLTIDQQKTYTASIDTSEGCIRAELFASEAPRTVNNFVFLANQGFYDGVKFHRIIKGFMVQTGDPTGTGAGGPGYRFADEPVKRQYNRGILAMANAGPNTNGSQFFIMHADYGLQPNYTIFGQVTEGLDVLDKIANTTVKAGRGGENSVPTTDVTITSIAIEEK